jgi:hypothetical protein
MLLLRSLRATSLTKVYITSWQVFFSAVKRRQASACYDNDTLFLFFIAQHPFASVIGFRATIFSMLASSRRLRRSMTTETMMKMIMGMARVTARRLISFHFNSANELQSSTIPPGCASKLDIFQHKQRWTAITTHGYSKSMKRLLSVLQNKSHE